MQNGINVSIQKIRNKGITHSIRQKLENDGHIAKGSNLSGSVWGKIVKLVSEDEQAKKQYSGGSNFMEGYSLSAKDSYKNNFKIEYDNSKAPNENVMTFTSSLWNKIVALAKGQTPQDDEAINSLPENNNTPKKELVILEQEQDVGPEYTSEPIQPVPDGAKIQFRNIVNVDSNTKGNKETVITTTDDNGNKVYHQGITDDNGSTVMGSRLIADTRGLKQNEYYAVDGSIPDGAEVDRKNVDGHKDILNYEIKGNDGKTHRYLMNKDENGKYSKGDELFAIQRYSVDDVGNPYFTNTNKFVSETELNKKIQQIIPKATVKNLQFQNIETHIATDGSISFTKNGKRLTAQDLKPRNENGNSSTIVPEDDKGNTQVTDITPKFTTIVKKTPAPTPKVAPAPTPNNTPKPSAKGMTDAEVESYLQRDDNYQKRKADMEKADADMKKLEDKYGYKRGDATSRINIARTPDFSKYVEMENLMRFHSLEGFKETLKNWEDTPKDADISKHAIRDNGGTWTEVRKETLPDGTKVYNTKQGYFNLYFDGTIGDQMSIEELKKHGWTG